MIIVWHAINFNAIADYNIFLSNFLVFIYILKFGSSSTSQEVLGLLVFTTHFSTSTTYLPEALHYRGSYIRNKDDAKSLTTWKYRQFFATPIKNKKTEKKNRNVTPTNLTFPTTYRLTFLISQSIMSFFA